MLALSWNVTLIDISLTLLSGEACVAFAGELVGHCGTGTSVCTGMRQAGIRPLAQLTCRKDNRPQYCPRKWESARPPHPTSPTQSVLARRIPELSEFYREPQSEPPQDHGRQALFQTPSHLAKIQRLHGGDRGLVTGSTALQDSLSRCGTEGSGSIYCFIPPCLCISCFSVWVPASFLFT